MPSAEDGSIELRAKIVTRDGRSLGTATLSTQGGLAVFSAQLDAEVSGLQSADSFEETTIHLPAFDVPESARYLLTTYGLGGADGGTIGGYWPHAVTGTGCSSFPSQAFAPLVFYEEDWAVAVAPADWFLTSPLVRTADGAARALHGSIDNLSAGIRIETLFATGHGPGEALERLGDELLRRGGKGRPTPAETLATSKLGWWNAYGGYYTEPIRALDASSLHTVIGHLREERIPVRYVGIDLWYPYAEIGHGISFSPDPAKYPEGPGRAAGLPCVLHLSALAEKNAYLSDGSTPDHYERIAEEFSNEGAVAAWHDWLRTQQHQTASLRSDPRAAERWFRGMASAFAVRGIDVILCMQTMGMVLASTAEPNIVSARSAIDYLFAQRPALETLAKRGLPGFWNDATPAWVMRRQNLLVGFVLYALGLLPFHDLFLTRAEDGLGGEDAKIEAVLRALSCGPVGIGDGPGAVDRMIVSSLVLRDGTLLHPDRPPAPEAATLGSHVEVYRTSRQAGDGRWDYLVALNTTNEEQSFRVDRRLLAEGPVWDGLADRLADSMSGRLPPGGIAYYIVPPGRGSIHLLGLAGKLVPAAQATILTAQFDEELRVAVAAPDERLAVLSPVALHAEDEDGEALDVERIGDLHTIRLDRERLVVRITEAGGEA